MISHSKWLLTPVSLPAGTFVASEPEREWTHMELTPTRELLAWWISLAVTPGHSLFLVRESMPAAPPLPSPGPYYNPRADDLLMDFLSQAYAGIESWVCRDSDPRVKACIRALLDPNCCQAAWPTPTRILEIELEFMKHIEDELERGASPLKLVRSVMSRYTITPIQAREAINPVLFEILDRNSWDQERRHALLEIAYSGDIRDGIESQDRRLASAARTNQARAHGLISNRGDSRDTEDLTQSIIEAMARVGKANHPSVKSIEGSE